MANAMYDFNTSKVAMVMTASEDANTMKARLGLVPDVGGLPGTNSQGGTFTKVARYLMSIAGGARQGGKLLTATSAVCASGTVTLSSMVALDTITINGTVFTCESSGATGNQFNVGASDTITAANAAAAINASATTNVSRAVVATSSGAVITITAIQPGTMGNRGTLAISAHGSVSGANLTGGASDAWVTSTKGL